MWRDLLWGIRWDSEHEGSGGGEPPSPEPEHHPEPEPAPLPEPEPEHRPEIPHELAAVPGLLTQINETLGGLKSETEAQNARLQTIIEQHQADAERKVRSGHGIRRR